MADPSVQYRVVQGSEPSDEEAAGGAASSDDGFPPRDHSAHDNPAIPVEVAAGAVGLETEAFLKRQDSDEYGVAPVPIAKRNGRCGARAAFTVAAGLVLTLVVVAAALSQTLGIATTAPESPAAQHPPSSSTQAQVDSDSSEAAPAASSDPSSSSSSSSTVARLPDYTWDGKKCFDSNAELRAAIDSYLLDRNNATIERLYGLPIGAWCVRNVRDFSFAFASEGRPFSFPDRADELRDRMEKFNEDISNWDVTGARSLDRMFRRAKEFNQDLSKWDVSRVESMLGTFGFTQRFDADIRNWDVSKVRIFTAMFYQAQAFGRNLAYWNVSSATNTVSMFRNAPRYDHDMCAWAPLLEANNLSSADVQEMFMNSGCPEPTMVGPFFGEDPRWSRPGPFCRSCE